MTKGGPETGCGVNWQLKLEQCHLFKQLAVHIRGPARVLLEIDTAVSAAAAAADGVGGICVLVAARVKL
jgi:hypothetical protein